MDKRNLFLALVCFGGAVFYLLTHFLLFDPITNSIVIVSAKVDNSPSYNPSVSLDLTIYEDNESVASLVRQRPTFESERQNHSQKVTTQRYFTLPQSKDKRQKSYSVLKTTLSKSPSHGLQKIETNKPNISSNKYNASLNVITFQERRDSRTFQFQNNSKVIPRNEEKTESTGIENIAISEEERKQNYTSEHFGNRNKIIMQKETTLKEMKEQGVSNSNKQTAEVQAAAVDKEQEVHGHSSRVSNVVETDRRQSYQSATDNDVTRKLTANHGQEQHTDYLRKNTVIYDGRIAGENTFVYDGQNLRENSVVYTDSSDGQLKMTLFNASGYNEVERNTFSVDQSCIQRDTGVEDILCMVSNY